MQDAPYTMVNRLARAGVTLDIMGTEELAHISPLSDQVNFITRLINKKLAVPFKRGERWNPTLQKMKLQ